MSTTPASQRQGQWPWARDKLARLTTELMTRQQAAVLGFDVAVSSSRTAARASTGCAEMASGPLGNVPGLAAEVERLAPRLDHDATFAAALSGRRVALGYYFTRTEAPQRQGRLCRRPCCRPRPSRAAGIYATRWNGFVASIAGAGRRPRRPAGFLEHAGRVPTGTASMRAVPLHRPLRGRHGAAGLLRVAGAGRLPAWPSGSPPVQPALCAGGPASATPPLEVAEWSRPPQLRIPVDRQRAACSCRSAGLAARTADRSATCRQPTC